MGGQWHQTEANMHINYLELKAIEFGLRIFAKNNMHVQIMCDNTTAISYINKMGGIQSVDCDELSRSIWLWCKSRNILVSAAFIPGRDNKVADEKSRKFSDNTEWMLNTSIFQAIVKAWYTPDVDLFASRINKQLNRYVSWKPDPFAEKIDVFTFRWNKGSYFIFPPFSVISKTLQKMHKDNATGILIFSIVERKAPENVTITEILNFFSLLLEESKSFSVINTAKIAISNYLHIPPYKYLSEHPAMDKYFDGLYNINPPKAKAKNVIWDVNIVFNHFKRLCNSSLLLDKQLSQKLCLFLLLLGGQQVNTIYSFTTDNMILTCTHCSATLSLVVF